MRKHLIKGSVAVMLSLIINACGSSYSNPSTQNQKEFTDNNSSNTVKKHISFFVWDGVADIELLKDRLNGYENLTVYLNPVDNGEYKFEENAEIVQQTGADVWFLMSADATLDYVQAQIEKIAEYNRLHSQKVPGMSFDIEPWVYFENQNSSDNQEAWQAYLDFMSEAKKRLHDKDLKISIAIPFWIDRQTRAFPNNRPINYDVIDIADEVIVMTYTVFADRIEPYAKSSLTYAQEQHKDIKIALEMVQSDEGDTVSFYTHPEDIKYILNRDLNYTTFQGYTIHTLESFLNSGIVIGE